MKYDYLLVTRGASTNSVDMFTQRKRLSAVSSVYDPLGNIAPFTIRGRIILKELWFSVDQSWDTVVPQNKSSSFCERNQERCDIVKVKFPRCFFRNSHSNFELHTFVDESQSTLCAVVYLRSVCDEEVFVSFVVGKCRVAPMRASTISKLELLAVLIGMRICTAVKSFLPFNLERCFFWSDSSTVHHWIDSSRKKLPVFVANRVAEVLDNTTVDHWRFFPGVLNPADLGTRVLKCNEIMSTEWLTGASFLNLAEDHWPLQLVTFDESTLSANALSCDRPTSVYVHLWSTFSSFSKICRVVAFVRRFVNNLILTRDANRLSYRDVTPFSAYELATAELVFWEHVQAESFSNEVRALKRDQPIPISSQIAPLSPFMSGNLLKARGRVRKAPLLSFDQKHAIILSCHHPVVKSSLRKVHCADYFHEGVEYLKSKLQQRFWILGLRSELRRIKIKCVLCRKRQPLTIQPQMTDLPIARLASDKFPFAFTGVDLFGPFEVKIGRSVHKR